MRLMAILATAAAMMAGPALAQAQTQPPTAQPRAATPRPAAPAIPTRVTAATLGSVCAQDRNSCLTYVLGSADAFASALVAAGRPQVFCIPKGTTNDQVAQTAVRYIRSRPQEGGSNAALLVLAGLQAAYPCGY